MLLPSVRDMTHIIADQEDRREIAISWDGVDVGEKGRGAKKLRSFSR